MNPEDLELLVHEVLLAPESKEPCLAERASINWKNLRELADALWADGIPPEDLRATPWDCRASGRLNGYGISVHAFLDGVVTIASQDLTCPPECSTLRGYSRLQYRLDNQLRWSSVRRHGRNGIELRMSSPFPWDRRHFLALLRAFTEDHVVLLAALGLPAIADPHG